VNRAWLLAALLVARGEAAEPGYDERVAQSEHAAAPAESVKLALQAVALDRARPEGYRQAALAFYRLGAWDAAEGQCRQALSLSGDAGRPMVQALLDAILDRRRVDDYLDFSNLALSRGQFAEAAEWLLDAWKLFPSRLDLAAQAAEAAIHGGRCRQARMIADFLARDSGADEWQAVGESLRSALAQCRQANLPADWERLDAFTCAPGALLDRAHGRCVCSVLTPVWDAKSKQCARCPGNQQWLGVACGCPAGTTKQGDECRCPAATPAWSAGANRCVGCGYDGAWDARACSCPPGMAWNGAECRCPDDAPVWNAGQRTCATRASCAFGSACACSGGRRWNGAECVCTRDRPSWDGSTCVAP
jgi:hypothetical protein